MHSLTRRDFVVLSGAAAACTAWRPVLARTAAAVFPFGTHIYREPSLPLEQLAADLPVLKRLGFSMIKIQESWSTDERHPGEIDLSRVEKVVADARQNGLLVYFGVTMEQAPAWLWRKYPDATMLYEDGSPQNDPTQYLLSSDGKPGPCWHHPGARAAAETFIEAVGSRLSRYENIMVWNVWQEIGLAPWSTRPGHHYLCYCANTLNAFRGWLKERYGSLDALNGKWRTAFGTWDEVEPVRLFTPLPSVIDWRVFMEDQYLSDALRWKAEAFRRSDPSRRPVMAHTPGSNFGSTADWSYARNLDVYGTSMYPSWGEPEDLDVSSAERVRDSARPLEQLCNNVMLRVDYARSASPSGRIWAAELQGGRAGGGPAPGRVPDAGDIRRWVLGTLAAGARGICFWNHRNEPMWSENSGFGLLDRRGESTLRAEEAGRLARAIQAEADFFLNSAVPRPQVGILVDERRYQFASASEPAYILSQSVASVRGLYKALWGAGFAADFVNVEQLSGSEAAYKVLLLPAPLCMSNDVAARLAEYVKAGGTLISEATPGRFDEYGFGAPDELAAGFPQLFGVEHERLSAWLPDAAGGPPPNSSSHPWPISGTGVLAGKQAVGNLYLQTLRLRGAEAILTHGDYVVGSTHAYGQGRAILIGTLLGSAIADNDATGNAAVIASLVTAAGVNTDRVGSLLRRRRVLGKASAWFLINPTHQTVRETLQFEAGSSVSNLLTGALSLDQHQLTVEVAPLDIACLMVRQAPAR